MDKLSLDEKQTIIQNMVDRGGLPTDDPIWLLIDKLQEREKVFDALVLNKLEALEKKTNAIFNMKSVVNSTIDSQKTLSVPHWQIFSIISIPTIILIGFVAYFYPQIRFVNSDGGRFLSLCFSERDRAFIDDPNCKNLAKSLKISYPPKLTK
jgi:hypothetical protein